MNKNDDVGKNGLYDMKEAIHEGLLYYRSDTVKYILAGVAGIIGMLLTIFFAYFLIPNALAITANAFLHDLAVNPQFGAVHELLIILIGTIIACTALLVYTLREKQI